MIYGSIRVHMGPQGPVWVARGEKGNVENVKIIISDSDFFQGLCPGDTLQRQHGTDHGHTIILFARSELPI